MRLCLLLMLLWLLLFKLAKTMIHLFEVVIELDYFVGRLSLQRWQVQALKSTMLLRHKWNHLIDQVALCVDDIGDQLLNADGVVVVLN